MARGKVLKAQTELAGRRLASPTLVPAGISGRQQLERPERPQLNETRSLGEPRSKEVGSGGQNASPSGQSSAEWAEPRSAEAGLSLWQRGPRRGLGGEDVGGGVGASVTAVLGLVGGFWASEPGDAVKRAVAHVPEASPSEPRG